MSETRERDGGERKGRDGFSEGQRERERWRKTEGKICRDKGQQVVTR